MFPDSLYEQRDSCGSRGGVRSWPSSSLAALLCILLLAGLAAGAQAQVLVSNLGQPDASTRSFRDDNAQEFTTGGNSGGYTLTSVDVEFSALKDADLFTRKLTATIRSDSSGVPGTVLSTLVNPVHQSTTTGRTYNFKAPGRGLDLAAGTTYWFVLDVTGIVTGATNAIRTTASYAEDAVGADAWSIADRAFRRDGDDLSSWGQLNNPMKIRINSVPRVVLSVSPSGAITEGGNPLTVTATRSEANTSGSPLTIPIRVKTAGTTAGDGDYMFGDSISIANNATSGTATFTATDDSRDEPQETVVLEFGAVPSGTEAPPDDEVLITITDNDPTVVSLARVGTGDVGVGRALEFTVRLTRALEASEIVDVPLSVGGTGVTTGDWSLRKKPGAGNTGVTLRDTNTATPKVRFSGAGARTATLELTPAAEKTFTVKLGTNTAFDALGTNVDDGADPHSTDNSFNVYAVEIVEVSIAGGSAIMEGTDASFTLTASPPPASGITVNVDVTERGSFAVSGQTGRRTVTVGTSGTASLTVATEDDETPEHNGAITATVKTGNGYEPHGTQATAEVPVNSEDGGKNYVVTTKFSPLGDSGPEGGKDTSKLVWVIMTLDHNAKTRTGFRVCFSGWETSPAAEGTAKRGSGEDYRVINAAHSTLPNECLYVGFGKGSINQKGVFIIQVFGDTEIEPDETVTVYFRQHPTELSRGNSFTFSPPTLTYTIEDDDTPLPEITITGGSEVTEGGIARFTIEADNMEYLAPGESFDVNLRLGDAPGPADFIDVNPRQTVRITAGETSKTFEVPTTDDSGDEPNGPVTVTVQSGQGYTVGTPDSAAVTVKDDDPTIVDMRRIGNSGVIAEGGSTFIEIQLRRGGTSDSDRRLTGGETLTVPLVVLHHAGVSPGEVSLTCRYSPSCGAGVTLLTSHPYSAASPAVRFTGSDAVHVSNILLTLRSIGDPDPEGTERVEVDFGPTGLIVTNLDGGVTTAGGAVVDIEDNDTPKVIVTGESLSLREGGSPGSYRVRLATEPTGTVTVTATTGAPDIAKVHTGTTGTPGTSATLTFTQSGANIWSQDQTVTVTPASRGDIDPPEEDAIISHAVSAPENDPYDGLQAPSVAVTVADVATPGLIITITDSDGETQSLVDLDEGGDAETYEVMLATRPEEDVTVTATINKPDKAKIHTGTTGTPGRRLKLEFTTTDWETPQEITVTPSPNNIDPPNEDAIISYEVTSDDSDYEFTLKEDDGTLVQIEDRVTPPPPTLPPPVVVLPPTDDDDADESPDRDALRSVYDAAVVQNWNGDEPVEDWPGVEEVDEDGRVTELDLGESDLSGKIHVDIGNLEKLRILYLNDNELTEEIPEEIGDLAELEELDLSGNAGLCGELPLGLNRHIRDLDIDGTRICVPDDPRFRAWFFEQKGFEESEDCAANCEEEPDEPAAGSSGGGGCAVASGVLGAGAYQFVLVTLVLAAAVLGRRKN